MASTAKEIYISGLSSAHALEQQAIQILERQAERLENYPELAARIREHVDESREQQARLGRILESLGSSHSSMKDMGMGLMGNLAAMAHVAAQDEVLKDTFANFAFENYEIASYRSLITFAEAAGDLQSVPVLQRSLQEEEAMAEWIDEHLDQVIRTYLQRESGQQRETGGQKPGV